MKSKNRQYNLQPTKQVEVAPIISVAVEVVPMYVVEVGDEWLRSWSAYSLTSDRSEAMRLEKGIAEGYADYIEMCKHRKAKAVLA